MKDNVNISIENAITRLKIALERFTGDSKSNLDLAIKALKQSGAGYLNVSNRMNELLKQESRLNSSSEKWAEDVYVAALAMKRHIDCKKHFESNPKEIDGETQSMWISKISAIIGLLATVAVGLLLLFNVIDKISIDDLAYIIALGGWVTTIVVSLIAKGINKHLTKKHDSSSEYTVAELMAAKYADSGDVVGKLLPSEVRPLFYAARDINIKKLEFTNDPQSKTPEFKSDRDINIEEIKL